jgi:UDP-glucose 4-epimerase
MKNYSMNICILRFFNVLSSNQDFNRVSPPLLNYIVREIIHRRVPVLHGSGEQKRDFVHINDVLEMIDLVVKNNSTGVFNVCSGKNISINEIYAKTAKILQSDIVPRYESAEMLWDNYQELFIGGNSLDKVRVEDEVLKSSSGSYRKAQEKLGWEPHTNFESLFKETVENISAEVRTYFEI